MTRDTVVLYHANCPDGFGSAWSFWKKYGNSIEYIPVNHGEPPPDVSGKDLFIVDFSYPRDILLKLKESVKSIIVIDHHLSAQKDLGDLDFCHFDMEHSGSYLAWVHLFGEESVAPLVRYVEDRDLWKWELPNSECILSAVDSYPKDFKVWDRLNDMLSLDHTAPDVSWGFNKLKAEGEAILRYKDNLIESLLENSYRMNIAGFDVPIVNAPFFQSELASKLSEDESFAAAYYYNGEGYRISLRSSDDGEDVSTIATELGGGGHKQAAAFSVKSIDEFVQKMEKK
jgi:oligoribonuclease NrnB/cAMP/cGMP phosphodiesterase (DHH superfamily)